MIVGVYGLGRFGYFWAKVLSSRFQVIAYSRNESRKVPDGVRKVSEEEVLKADALFLCVSISAMESVVSAIAPRLQPDSVLFDTCSVKVHPVEVMKKYTPEETRIIATHPMFGPDSGRDGVSGLPLVFSPVRCDSSTVQFWRDSFREIGLQIFEMTPDEHDFEAAYTQGITHFIGRVLNALNLQPSDIGTLGYNKLLEIVEQTCNDPVQLFYDLQHYNPHTKEMRQNLYTTLKENMNKLDTLIHDD